jgi:hypothetical protein
MKIEFPGHGVIEVRLSLARSDSLRTPGREGQIHIVVNDGSSSICGEPRVGDWRPARLDEFLAENKRCGKCAGLLDKGTFGG